jgi:hypothetical protein
LLGIINNPNIPLSEPLAILISNCLNQVLSFDPDYGACLKVAKQLMQIATAALHGSTNRWYDWILRIITVFYRGSVVCLAHVCKAKTMQVSSILADITQLLVKASSHDVTHTHHNYVLIMWTSLELE